MRALYHKDPSQKLKKTSAYRRLNPEYGLTRGRLKKGGGKWVGDVTAEDLTAKLEEHDNKCYICGIEFDEQVKVHWDHYRPIAKGGDHSLANLRPACEPCNQRKQSSWPVTEELLIRIAQQVETLRPSQVGG